MPLVRSICRRMLICSVLYCNKHTIFGSVMRPTLRQASTKILLIKVSIKFLKNPDNKTLNNANDEGKQDGNENNNQSVNAMDINKGKEFDTDLKTILYGLF